MKKDSAGAKDSDLDWVTDVSNALSDEPETCKLWLKLFDTVETQGPSVAKSYLMSVFEALIQQTTADIDRIKKLVTEEARHES